MRLADILKMCFDSLSRRKGRTILTVLGVFIGAGNLDSMVAHYTAAKRRRSEDFYSPGKRSGCRPDRAAIVYCNRAREAFGSDMPIILGSLEASQRRFAHYDYWDDSVRRAILFDAPADLLVYGCDFGQGYLVARPLAPDAVPAYLRGAKGYPVTAPASLGRPIPAEPS